MSTSDASTPASADRSLRGLLLLLATIAGVAVANIYYNQPLLDNFRQSFPNSASWVGVVPAVTQLGYAAGMLLLAPLGDRFDRRKLILLQTAGMCVTLVIAAAAQNLPVLIAASLAIGQFGPYEPRDPAVRLKAQTLLKNLLAQLTEGAAE